jgi:hypothetical protein
MQEEADLVPILCVAGDGDVWHRKCWRPADHGDHRLLAWQRAAGTFVLRNSNFKCVKTVSIKVYIFNADLYTCAILFIPVSHVIGLCNSSNYRCLNNFNISLRFLRIANFIFNFNNTSDYLTIILVIAYTNTRETEKTGQLRRFHYKIITLTLLTDL